MEALTPGVTGLDAVMASLARDEGPPRLLSDPDVTIDPVMSFVDPYGVLLNAEYPTSFADPLLLFLRCLDFLALILVGEGRTSSELVVMLPSVFFMESGLEDR